VRGWVRSVLSTQMELTVVFINPEDISYATKSDVLYIGDMKQRSHYPESSNVRWFVSLTRWTHLLAPLLALSETPVIHIEHVADDRRITVTANVRTPDIEEYLDYFLSLSSPHLHMQGDINLYREMLGPVYSVESNQFQFFL
jgi:hypothetical protein